MPLSIDEAVSKYGGEDEAYKNKLKEGIRDAMGYSNFSSQLSVARKSNPNINLKGDLNPATILGNIDSAFGRKQSEVSSLQGAMRTVDSAADSIASRLASKNKAEDKYRVDSTFIYDPKNPVDYAIQEYANNPYNEDGSVKSLQQFESELNEKFGQTEGYSPEDIKGMIVHRLPKDYIGKENFYKYRFQGMSEKAATDEVYQDYADEIIRAKQENRKANVPPEMFPHAFAILTPTEQYYWRTGKTGGRTSGGREL